MKSGLIKLPGLTETDFAQIRQLAEFCQKYDHVTVKLNWELMKYRDPAVVSDFCYYSNDQLVGYVPLDGFGESFEITGIVHPDFRRQGIFRQLMSAARDEAKRREARQLLLVNYKHSESGTALAKALALPYRFSEYHMIADLTSIPPLPKSQLQLVEVTIDDLQELSRLLSIAFGEGGWSAVEELREQFQRKDGQYWFARLGTENIGQIGVVADQDGIYIRAVGIVPEYRNKGYGRQLLAILLRKLLDEGHQHFELDVEVKNASALSLYESCGFHESNVYDYYEIAL
jgi:ribosomal protein S18 acetylase RimI-like enzyme